MKVVVDDRHVAILEGQVLVLRRMDQEASQLAAFFSGCLLLGRLRYGRALGWGLNDMVIVLIQQLVLGLARPCELNRFLDQFLLVRRWLLRVLHEGVPLLRCCALRWF